MSNDDYLRELLWQQNLTDQEIEGLRGLRDQTGEQLRALPGRPRFFYAGSYGKKTMIRARYDLDSRRVVGSGRSTA